MRRYAGEFFMKTTVILSYCPSLNQRKDTTLGNMTDTQRYNNIRKYAILLNFS